MTPAEFSKAHITYNVEAIEFDLSDSDLINDWIKQTIEAEAKKLGTLNFIFCSDDYLHKINVDYLQHDTLTDVITFPYSRTQIEGDIFISIDRVRENATLYQNTFEKELRRVMIHGVLHLCGYGDKTPTEEKEMRAKEDQYLSKL